LIIGYYSRNFEFVSVLPGIGDGTMLPSVEYPVGASTTSSASADLDGDGWPDLVTANYGSNNFSVLLNRSIRALN